MSIKREATKLGDCLGEAKETICGERQDVYGSPEDSFTIIAKYWNTYLMEVQKKLLTNHGFNLEDYKLVDLLTAKDVAHMMILFKMARVQGQAPKRDNYVDLCGYASIAADRLFDMDANGGLPVDPVDEQDWQKDFIEELQSTFGPISDLCGRGWRVPR